MTPPVLAGPLPDEAGSGLRRLTVQGWFLLVVAVLIVLTVVCGAVGAVVLRNATVVSERLVDRISPARIAVAQLESAVIDQETGVRGYLLTGDQQFLLPYTAGIAAERRQAERAASLIGDQPELLADLAAVRNGTADWRRRYAEPFIAGRRAGSSADTGQVAASKQTFDHIRALFNVADTHFQQARSQARADLERLEAIRNWAFAAILAVFLLSGVAVALLLHRAIGRPLDALRASSRKVASGDFGHRIEGLGPADIRAVALDVENMRQGMVRALEAAEEQQQRLRRQTADLDAQAEELRRSNTELEQFAYVASHDLQEPLRKVISFCQLIAKRYGDQLDERGQQYIAFTVDGAKRMQILINDLLTFSRVGRLHDTRATVELDPAVDKALGNLSQIVEETGARVERPESLPEVTGDATLMTMLWQNLIGNSVKFRHADRPPVIRIGCERDGGFWRLCVTDNGIGVPAEFSEKVFVIFQRLHTRDAYSGTGIGLALCKKIVEHHGGQIWIDTAYTEGTRICFTLPAMLSDRE
ncbi:histidine kinase [Microtetraspora sp. NBRC 13810]|uniref:sensor histidine kinase n=1 Tax=Microtetraspora sp. NBRC 13810 TaxID=3030990 RepID=UPI0024A4F0DF|nr:sensor histidine kinase [Microtetraspora sp. NBRC 13810]GLW07210.1 histidine kinase [Microtetraspora sp. NBRC 13810]